METLETIFAHRSIRKYQQKDIPQQVLDKILEAGTRASNTGNMQVYSVVVTRDAEMKKRLAPFHFNQPMVTTAPVVLHICADVHLFHRWCEINRAEKSYDNFLWFVCGCIDATLFAQNVGLAAEACGLGFCILGTALYSAAQIAEVLQLPEGVCPVMTMTLGYPAEEPALTDRLPLKAVVHNETYRQDSDEEVRELFREKDNSALTQQILKENNLPNLAQVFTQRRYPKSDNVSISNNLLTFLRINGFLNNE